MDFKLGRSYIITASARVETSLFIYFSLLFNSWVGRKEGKEVGCRHQSFKFPLGNRASEVECFIKNQEFLMSVWGLNEML